MVEILPTKLRIINVLGTVGGAETPDVILKEYGQIIDSINQLESFFESLTDDELRAKTSEFKERIRTSLVSTQSTTNSDPGALESMALDEILPEAFATVREAAKRTLGIRLFDVQLMAGIAMHDGNIAEMQTGEGKTLAAILPAYLNALLDKGVHIVTANDYLARRDARWTEPIFKILGMSVGVLQMSAITENGKKAFMVDTGQKDINEQYDKLRMVPRKDAYRADVTYGTISEFGFDYLKDNLVKRLEDKVQRGHNFIIIDEVDNVLIDEARVPLIISGSQQNNPEAYKTMTEAVQSLDPKDCDIDPKNLSVVLLPSGVKKIESILKTKIVDTESPEQITPDQAHLMGILNQALKARFLYKKGVQYLVQGGKVVIINEFTGRPMPGRRWSNGLHQAVEAKEGVKIYPENVVHAVTTIQNYVKLYRQLSGMSGTALTDAQEFSEVYGLNVIPIPTNKERQRIDEPDSIYRTEESKIRAVILDILTCYVKGRPVLIGTASVDKSENLSKLLGPKYIRTLLHILFIRDKWFRDQGKTDKGVVVDELRILNLPLEELVNGNQLDTLTTVRPWHLLLKKNLPNILAILKLTEEDLPRLADALSHGIPHSVLNARNHAIESEIILKAGAPGAVTIATNMAGRGADIKLGGEISQDVERTINQLLLLTGHKQPFTMTYEEKYSALVEIGIVNTKKGSRNVKITENLRRHRNLPPIGYIYKRRKYRRAVAEFADYVNKRKEVLELGGLRVIGTERHEARRIDNQLRGRAARQGDPGSTKFYLSFEDELMQLFGGDKIRKFMKRLKIDDSVPLTSRGVSGIVEDIQTRAEGRNFDIRKHLLEYDKALNEQRQTVYSQRDRIMSKGNVDDFIKIIRRKVDRLVKESLSKGSAYIILDWLEDALPLYEFQGTPYPTFTEKLIVDRLQREGKSLETSLKRLTIDAIWSHPNHDANFIKESTFRDIEVLDIPEKPNEAQLIQLIRHIEYSVSKEKSKIQRVETYRVNPRISLRHLAAKLFKETILKNPELAASQIMSYLEGVISFQKKAWGEYESRHTAQEGEENQSNKSKINKGEEVVNSIYNLITVTEISSHWAEHITIAEALRTSAGTEAYARNDPLTVYTHTISDLFYTFFDEVADTTLLQIFKAVPPEAKIDLKKFVGEAIGKHKI